MEVNLLCFVEIIEYLLRLSVIIGMYFFINFCGYETRTISRLKFMNYYWNFGIIKDYCSMELFRVYSYELVEICNYRFDIIRIPYPEFILNKMNNRDDDEQMCKPRDILHALLDRCIKKPTPRRRCYRCGKQGHMAHQCRTPGTNYHGSNATGKKGCN